MAEIEPRLANEIGRVEKALELETGEPFQVTLKMRIMGEGGLRVLLGWGRMRRASRVMIFALDESLSSSS
jgi:hypothetical protein